MRSRFLLALCLLAPLALTLGGRSAAAAPDDVVLHHEVVAKIDPAGHKLLAEDSITFPAGWENWPRVKNGQLEMRLHAALEVKADPESCFDVLPVREDVGEGGSKSGEEGAGHRLRIKRWMLALRKGRPAKGAVARLRLSGTIHHPLVAEGEEYARSFSRTPGTIDEEGVMLSGASWWLPRFGDELLTFRLTVNLPEGWDAVSQGKRTAHGLTEGRRIVTWDCPHPMDEIYVIASRFTEYARSAGNLTAYAFLRNPDPNLANKYLEVTAQYIDMYRRLIGRYPFGKFALVENFWETGYGMPSFTLLGPKVIRFPFILHSSYPHEILHNWWGNSVYVDWETGNWCEGLTAYLADHLIREGQGRGTEYRMDTLKNYRNYVKAGKDFPLTGFRSRHSSATQAVGYGKCLMLFHMLRRQLGDPLFARGLQQFYRRFKFKRAAFSDIKQVFSDIAGKDLGAFFEQWVERTGAPEIELSGVEAEGNRLSFDLQQVQAGALYTLRVPVAVTLEGEAKAYFKVLDMSTKQARFELDLPGRPVRVDVDPQFDMFRRLHRSEIPPTLSEMFGAEKVTLVVPAAGKDPLAGAWRTFAESWARGGKIPIVTEDELKDLPADTSIWVLGSKNAWQRVFQASLERQGAGPAAERFDFGLVDIPRAGHSFTYVVRHPANPDLSIGWVGSEVAEALPGLARKLPHYGKYSYLGFAGNAPDNVAKGRWPAVASPLSRTVGQAADADPIPRGTLETRQPLERLAPVFDPERLMAHVSWLADDAREGRGIGSKGLDASAEYIAAAFKKAGLKPGGEYGSYFQTFTAENGPDGKPVTMRNVVAVLPGTAQEARGESVVLGAHYDHLGRGWPDVRQGHAGKIHNGADDNASGVAVLLEVAALLGKQLTPRRSVVFVAFSGEEWGLKGSAHYAATDSAHPAKKAIAMVNLDTVGRLQGKKLMLLGSGTATEWRHIAMGVGFTTGVESNCVSDDPGGSDQASFHEIGVPAVQFFSGGHTDYHRSTDDVEKVDADGLVKVAIFTRETIVYLSERPTPLTSTLKTSTLETGTPQAGAKPVAPKRPTTGRRVSFGTMPAFDFPGPGIKVAAVTGGSPAEKAGIRVGDMLVSMDGEVLKDLRTFSTLLRKHAPGDVVRIVLDRDGSSKTFEVTLGAR